MVEINEATLQRAAQAIANADALVIGAGAGMGVDSGLPDFRGKEGFWRAYPPYAKLGLAFEAIANPRHFANDPALAWGFYGHRTNLYRATQPHPGFAILQRWAQGMDHGAFVFTSNVDGHFQKAGFGPERVVECHGSIEWSQCLVECGAGIFPTASGEIAVDPESFRAGDPLPACPGCGGLARPNILMFGDGSWDSGRTDEQALGLEHWMESVAGASVVFIELGAGLAVPTVRRFCESVATYLEATLIRVNPREFDVPSGQIAIDSGALPALRAIDDRLDRSGGEGLDQR